MADRGSFLAKRTKRWLTCRLPKKIFYPLLALLLIFLAVSLFNLFSIWQVRREMMANLEALKVEIKHNETNSDAVDIVGWPTAAHLNFDIATGETITASSTVAPVSVLAATNSDVTGKVVIPVAVPGSNPPVDQVVVSAQEAQTNFIPVFKEQLLSGTMNSFGDTFSSLAYINQEETDMYWDSNVTAFTFPPLFKISEEKNCSTPDCGLSRAAVDPQSICLPAGCLRRDGDRRLFFKDKELQLPPALSDKTFSDITIFSPDNKTWLIGLVSGPDEAEQGWVYRFDGLSFSPLLTDQTEYQIKPRFQRGGGKIAFGGDKDDILVLYAGYDGAAFRIRGKNIEDVGNFFGLRVTDGGFQPQIFSIGSGNDKNFYVCSLTENKPKVIKIWNKDALNSGGVIDLSPLLFKNDWRPESILCAVSDIKNHKLTVASKTAGVYQLRVLEDKGFDNGR